MKVKQTLLLLLAVLTSMNFLHSAPLGIQAYNLNGSVQINGKSINQGMVVKAGDRITVSSGSSADIRFPNGSLARIKNGELEIQETQKKIGLKLNYGQLYSSVKPGTQYDVTSSTAAAGVRGTQFLFEEQIEKKKSYICVCHGSVWVKKPGGEDEKVVKAGEDIWVNKSVPLKDPVVNPRMSMLTVDEITDLEQGAKAL